MSTIVRLQRERGQQFGAGHLVDILLGRETERMVKMRHAELSTFGIGTELGEAEWRGVVRQLLAQGLLQVQGVPAHVVFSDATLAAIAQTPAGEPAELSGISGVGTVKLERYGQAVLEVAGAGT